MNLTDLSARLGFDELARWLPDQAALVDALVNWPPAPKRGRVYSGPERERLIVWVQHLPRVVAFQRDVRAWNERMAALYPLFAAVWDTGSDYRTTFSTPQSHAAHVRELVADQLVGDWPKGEARDQAWLASWTRTHVDPMVDRWRRQLVAASDPKVYDPGTSIPWLLQQVDLDPEGLERILRRVHGVRWLGHQGVPSLYDVLRGAVPWRDVERALARREREEAERQARELGDTLTAWRVLAAAFATLGPAPSVQALRRALPAGSEVDIRVRGRAPDIRTDVRVTLANRTYLGPEAPDAAQAMSALSELAKLLAGWTPPSGGNALEAWQRAQSAARRELEDGRLMRNPDELSPPGAGGLTILAEAVGLEALAGWLRDHGPEVGALVFDQRNWKVDWPSGWVTTVARDQAYSRVEVGALPPGLLTGLRAREGEPNFQAPAWEGLVERVRAHGVRSPVMITRKGSGEIELWRGRDDVLAAVHVGQATVPVMIGYARGTDEYGLILDPATGVFEPFPRGQRVYVRRVKGMCKGVVLDVPGRATGPVGTYRVRLDDGREVDAHTEDLDRLNVLPLAPPPRTRGNPGAGRPARVAYDPRSQLLVVRTPDARARLMERLRSALLTDAVIEHGVVHGRLIEEDGPPPRTSARWRTLEGEPGAWAAFASADTPGRVYLVASPDAYTLARLSPAPLRPNRVTAPDRVGEALFDAEGRRYAVVYQVVEAALDGSTVATSHQPLNLEQWTPGYPRDFQTRDLGSLEESAKIREIARKLDPERLLGRNLDATLGPPVAWEGRDGRLYVLGGNGRALAILTAPEDVYERYVEAGRALLTCWPSAPARPGFRWMLLRIVQGASREEAARLAAASQMSTAAEEGRLGRALGLVRSLALRLDDLPAIAWTEPITSANVGEFARTNAAFLSAILGQVDAARRQVLVNDPDRLAPVVEAVLLGFLPQPLQRAGLFGDPKLEDALLGGLPALATLRTNIQARAIYPVFDLLTALPAAVGVFQFLQQRRMSFRALEELLAGEGRTERLADAERLVDTPPLALALAGALTNAARRAAPAVVLADMLRAYLDVVQRFDPRQAGLFGGPRLPDPADVLAGLVPGFRLPERTRANPAPGPVGALVFDRAHFPSASDARDWCKARGHHPGVPESVPEGWRILQRGAPARNFSDARRVPMDAGVTALV